MPRSRPPSARNAAKIKRVLTILDGHVGQRHELGELATMAGLSRSYFSRTFHKVVGMALRDYLRAQKLKRARELVRTSRRSLTDIAVESGFYDLPHLDKAFRQRFGTSPYDFRARHTERPGKTRRAKPPHAASTSRQPPSASRRVP
jgi:transcriptional regulator GlxA family with amidase domain